MPKALKLEPFFGLWKNSIFFIYILLILGMLKMKGKWVVNSSCNSKESEDIPKKYNRKQCHVFLHKKDFNISWILNLTLRDLNSLDEIHVTLNNREQVLRNRISTRKVFRRLTLKTDKMYLRYFVNVMMLTWVTSDQMKVEWRRRND